MLPGFRRGSVFYLVPFSLEEGPERGNSPRPSDKEVVDFLASWRVTCREPYRSHVTVVDHTSFLPGRPQPV